MRSIASVILPLLVAACVASSPTHQLVPGAGTTWPRGPNPELLPIQVQLMEMAQHVQARVAQPVYVVALEPTPVGDSLVVVFRSSSDTPEPLAGTLDLLLSAATRLDLTHTDVPRIETRVPACTMTKMGSSDANPTRFCPEARSTDPPSSVRPHWHFVGEPVLLVSSSPLAVPPRVSKAWLLGGVARPVGITGPWAAVALSADLLKSTIAR